MDQKLHAMLNDSEQELLRAIEPKRLRKLDEDELIDLHTRVRRARTKYTKLYRRRAGAQVSAKKARSGASAGGSKTRRKAEAFEDALATVSARLADVARKESEQLRADRLAAAKGARSGASAKKGTTAGSGKARGKGSTGRRGDGALKSPSRKRTAASQRSTKRRQQAARAGK